MCLSDQFILKHGRKYGYIEIILGILLALTGGIIYLRFNSNIQFIADGVQSTIETIQNNHEIMSLGGKSIETVIDLLTASVKGMFVFTKGFCVIVTASGIMIAHNGLLYLRLKELADKAYNKTSEQVDIMSSS